MLNRWRVIAIGLAVLTAALLAVVVVQGRMLLSAGWTVPLGNVAEGVGAIGGLATVGALVVAWLVYRGDQVARVKDERVRRLDEQRKQAELVTGWLDDHIEAGLSPDDVRHFVRLHLLNASQGVVYDVFVRVIAEPEDPVSVGGAAPEHRQALGYTHALPPKSSQMTISMPSMTHAVKGLEIYFRDARNQRWMRDASGMLSSSEGDPFPVVRDAFWRVKLAPGSRLQVPIQILRDETPS